MLKLKDYFLALVVILGFYFKLLLYPEYFIVDDILAEFLPKMISISQAMQNFEIPFLNASSFMGANPHAMDLENLLYNLFYIPFYLFSSHKTITSSFTTLIAYPYLLQLLLAYIGMCKLCLNQFKLSGLGAHVGCIIYTCSPCFFVHGLLYVPELTVYALLPWAMLAQIGRAHV